RRRDAEGIHQIQHPGRRAAAAQLGGQRADRACKAERRGEATGAERLVRRKLPAGGGRFVARAHRQPAEADLVHDGCGAVERFVEPRTRRDAPPEATEAKRRIAPHPIQRERIGSEEPQLASGHRRGRIAQRLDQRRGERRASAEDGDSGYHVLAGSSKKQRTQPATYSISASLMSGRIGRQHSSFASASATGYCPSRQPYFAKAGCRWIGVGYRTTTSISRSRRYATSASRWSVRIWNR